MAESSSKGGQIAVRVTEKAATDSLSGTGKRVADLRPNAAHHAEEFATPK